MPHNASRYDCRGDARHEAHSLPSQLFDLILQKCRTATSAWRSDGQSCRIEKSTDAQKGTIARVISVSAPATLIFVGYLESWVRICHNAHWHDRAIAVHHRPNT